MKLKTPSTTAIGSLPHHNIDSALEFSFKTDVPFLPQIPIRNPWEYMIAQALEGIPGLEIDKEGGVLLDIDVWNGRSKAFNEKLLSAYSHAANRDAFSAFEPSSAASSSWQPFLWELEERKSKFAKIQLAGPLTSQWVLRLKDGSPAEKQTDLGAQIYRLVLARALAMARRLQALSIQPIFFLDEPGLYALSMSNPRHVMSVQELKLMLNALAKEDVLVGIHCCSSTDWKIVLSMGIHFLSIDTHLSLGTLLEHTESIETFLSGGGRFSFGVIPTSRDPEKIHALNAKALMDELRLTLTKALPSKTVDKILSEALFTPACGLALHSPSEAEAVLGILNQLPSLV